MKIALIRWTIFLIIGLPFQFIVVKPIYAILYLIARLFWQKHYNAADKYFHPHPTLSNLEDRIAKIDNEFNLFKIHDNHNLLAQYTIASAPQSFSPYILNKNNHTWFLRKPLQWATSEYESTEEVSGDCVVAFCFAAAIHKKYFTLKKEILSLTYSYMVHLGTASFDRKNNGHISARCNNFGLNWCPDGWMGLGQPMFGPNFYTTSALLALASVHSIWWRIVFWIHWWLLGGWYWAFMPAIYPPDGLWYARDIIMKALWVHLMVFGKRWWIVRPMQITNATTPSLNLLFEAMLGKLPDNVHLLIPDYVNRFWSQTKNAVSDVNDSDYFVTGIRETLIYINKQSKSILRR